MLGIKENNNPIDIKYLTKALRDTIHKHPEREEYYKKINFGLFAACCCFINGIW